MSYIYDNDSFSGLNQDTKIDLSEALNVHRLLSSFVAQNSLMVLTRFCFRNDVIYVLL